MQLNIKYTTTSCMIDLVNNLRLQIKNKRHLNLKSLQLAQILGTPSDLFPIDELMSQFEAGSSPELVQEVKVLLESRRKAYAHLNLALKTQAQWLQVAALAVLNELCPAITPSMKHSDYWDCEFMTQDHKVTTVAVDGVFAIWIEEEGGVNFVGGVLNIRTKSGAITTMNFCTSSNIAVESSISND